MSRYQSSILWLGLILIALNIIVNIGEFKSVLFGGSPGGVLLANTTPSAVTAATKVTTTPQTAVPSPTASPISTPTAVLV